MKKNHFKVLYIEDNQGDFVIVKNLFLEFPVNNYSLEHSPNLTDAKEKIILDYSFDVIMLDLGLPESNGIETLKKTLAFSREIPIVVLTGLDDDIGLEVIKLGAQDYIGKNNLQPNTLYKTLLFSIERKKNEQIIQANLDHFRLISENINMIVCELDEQGNFTYINQDFISKFGYSQDELLGRSFSILINDSHKHYYIDEIKPLLYDDQNIKIQWQLNSKESASNWFEVIGNVLFDQKGNKKIHMILHEITEFKEKIDAAKNRERMFKNIADFSPMMIFAAGKNKQFTYFNNSMLKFTGKNLKEQLGFGLSECIHPLDRLQFWNKYFLAFTSKENFTIEVRMKKHDDTYGWILLNGVPNFYFENEFSGFLFSGLEITNRKEFIQEITYSENLLKQVLEILPVGVLILDENLNKLKCNKAFLGVKCDDNKIGMNEIELEDFSTGNKTNLFELAVEFSKNTKRTFIKQLYKIYAPDHKIFSLLSLLRLKDENGKNNGLIIVSEDITNFKLAEQALSESETLLSTIFREVPAPVFIATVNEGIIIDANTAFQKVSGFNLSYLIAKSIEELKLLKKPKELHTILKTLIKQKFIKNYEVDFKTRTGKEGSALISARLLKIKNQMCVVAVLNDITESKAHIKQIENYIKELQENKAALEEKSDQLTKLNDDLNKINANKDRFFSIIAHDLRSPFSTMLGISEFLIQNFDDISSNENHEFNLNLNKSLNSVFRLLENLLHWANFQTGRLTFEPIVFDINQIVEQVLEIIKPTAENKFIKLENNLSEELPVYADKNMISAVIRNLISNSVKFTNSGGKVTINASIESGNVQISISDNGIGIPDETLQKLFKVEEKITTRGTQNEKGTGLGLILCREFIEKHGGTIRAESEVGKGSDFIFTLPILKEISKQEF